MYLNSIDLLCYLPGMPSQIKSKNLNKIEIPLSSLDVQKRMAGILDHFDALCNDISAEIEARQKQHKYYRDKLQTFKEGKK